MTAYKLTVQDYQDLIDRGWRRSGTYVYKPTMSKTCCPMYTIRCNMLDFRLSPSQKKVIKRVNKYLSHGILPGKETTDEQHQPHDVPHSPRKDDTSKAMDVSIKERAQTGGGAASTIPVATGCSDDKSSQVAAEKTTEKSSSVTCGKSQHPKPGIGEDPTKPKCKKAKLRRLEKKKLKIEKTETRENSSSSAASEQCTPRSKEKSSDPKTLEDYLNDVVENPAHTLEIRLVRSSPRSSEFNQHFDQCYSVYFKYQTITHNDPPSKPSPNQYTRFLVESPLESEQEDGSLPDGYGSFHQLYILDGKVIAVGVIDILPKCVSSVYLYYDPDYSFLSLGTYSALRELAFTRHLHSLCSDINYYYLGFYIHSCAKMRYKGQYDPSYLLCPETYTWHKLDDIRKKLEDQRYCRFAETGIEDKDGIVDLDSVLVLHQRSVMSYADYQKKKKKTKKPGNSDRDAVNLYAQLAGMTCARRILLYRP